MNICASIESYKRRRLRTRLDPPLTIIKILLCRSLAILCYVLLQPRRARYCRRTLKLVCYKCTCRTMAGRTTRSVDGYLLFSYGFEMSNRCKMLLESDSPKGDYKFQQ